MMMNETLFDKLTRSLNTCPEEEKIEFNNDSFFVHVGAIDDVITFTCRGDVSWLDQKMLSWVVGFFIEKLERQHVLEAYQWGENSSKYEFDALRKNRVFVDELIAQLHFDITYTEHKWNATKQICVTLASKNRKEIMESLKDRGFFD